MLRLNLQKEPYWIDLPKGVRVKVHPLSTALMSAAQSFALKETRNTEDASQEEHTRLGLMESHLMKALARGAILEWDGVFTPTGDEAPVTPEHIDDLMDIWFISEAFWRRYTSLKMLLETEGKDSGLVVDGTSVAGQITVEAAKARTSPAAEARRTQQPRNTAPTSKTSHSHKKALKRGKFLRSQTGS